MTLNAERVLHAYLLGAVELETVLALQRRLAYEIGGEPSHGALLLFDHPDGITIGREGSLLDIRPSLEDLHTREWPVRWLSRGGGTMLHLPGQVACYLLLSLESLKLRSADFVRELGSVVVKLLRDFGVAGDVDVERPGIRVGKRRLAHLGVAVRGGVSCFGAVISVDPDLELFRDVCCDGDREPMTSIQREAPAVRVRVAAVRQRLVELIAARFRFDRVSLFHTLPGTLASANRHAVTPATR
jgi:lipoyl(octanoyl) transferase